MDSLDVEDLLVSIDYLIIVDQGDFGFVKIFVVWLLEMD